MFTEFGISLLCYASTFALCHVLRFFLRRLLPRASYPYAAEFVDTFHMICCLYENGMVLKLGLLPFAVCLFTLSIVYAFLFEGFANPAVVLDYVLRRKVSFLTGVFRVMLELIAAIVAYRYTTFVWKTFAPSSRHYQAATVEMLAENCSTGLNVSPLLGFAFEMTSVAFLKLVAGYFHGGRRFWRIINGVISVAIILFGLEYTGAPMNPILGFASGWGCKDHWVPSHLFVFWLGPFLGVSIGDWVVENLMDVDGKRTMTTSAAKSRERNGEVLEQNGNHEKIH
ncbi:aquaporin-11-like [Lytechinus pictus]|uniref:aquaporin-11-like n=1 Tax=Lytechinus pictus TaxID=7653 RepID=UPI0030B9BD58